MSKGRRLTAIITVLAVAGLMILADNSHNLAIFFTLHIPFAIASIVRSVSPWLVTLWLKPKSHQFLQRFLEHQRYGRIRLTGWCLHACLAERDAVLSLVPPTGASMKPPGFMKQIYHHAAHSVLLKLGVGWALCDMLFIIWEISRSYFV